MKTLLLCILLLISSLLYSDVTIFPDPSEPPRYEINNLNRIMENIAIDIYYEDISYPRKYVGTLIYSNGKYNLNSIVVPDNYIRI